MSSSTWGYFLILLVFVSRSSKADTLDYSYHDVGYGDPSSLSDADEDILEILDTLDYKDYSDMEKYQQVLDDILGQEVLEDKLRADFDNLMEDPELQGLRIAQDEDGALRFKDYILGEKSRIIKKSLPDEIMDNSDQNADGFQQVDAGYQPADAGYQPADADYQPVDAGYQPVDVGYQPADEEVQSADDEEQSADEEEQSAVKVEFPPADEGSSEEHVNNNGDISGTAGEDQLLAFEIKFGLAKVEEIAKKADQPVEEGDLYYQYEYNAVPDESGPLVVEDDGLEDESLLNERIREGLYEIEMYEDAQDGEGRGDKPQRSSYFQSLGKEVRVLEAVFYLGLCGGVILLVFGWVACVLALLRVRRAMEAQRIQEAKLQETRSVKVSGIIQNYSRLPLHITTVRPSNLAYSQLYDLA